MENKKKKEKEEVSLAPSLHNGEIITIEDADDLISIAQRRIGLIAEMIQFALHETNYRDWIDQDGKPYLVHSGAERVARLFGVKITCVDTIKFLTEDSKGKYYIYKTTGVVALPGRYDSIEAVGTCSQRDKFFSIKNGAMKESAKIDETNILKKSYTNFIVNGVTHLLGLRNITWEQLGTAGIDRSRITKIEYKKGAQKAEATLSEEELKNRNELWKICMNIAAGAEEEAKEILKAVTRFKPKDGDEKYIDDIKKFTSPKWIAKALERAKKKQQDFEDAIPDEEQ